MTKKYPRYFQARADDSRHSCMMSVRIDGPNKAIVSLSDSRLLTLGSLHSVEEFFENLARVGIYKEITDPRGGNRTIRRSRTLYFVPPGTRVQVLHEHSANRSWHSHVTTSQLCFDHTLSNNGRNYLFRHQHWLISVQRDAVFFGTEKRPPR